MSDSLQRLFRTTVVRLLRPLVRLLLRHGVPYKLAAEALKWTYADLAFREFGIDGRRNNKSRVAVITGLTRIEVDNQLKAGLDDGGPPKQYNRAARVLSGWAEDTQYQGEDGRPLDLPCIGPAPSFASLVEQYSGGTTLRAVLDEVLRVGAVAERQDGLLALLRPYYLAQGADGLEQGLDIFALAGSDLLGTMEHNLRPEQHDFRFQRVVEQYHLPLAQLGEARAFIRREGQILADRVDRHLLSLSRDVGDQPTVLRVGLGLYYYQDSSPQDPSGDKT